MNDKHITLAYGSGGDKYHQLVKEVFVPAFANPYLQSLSDSALCPIDNKKIAMTTDSFVIKPLFFPGGDIGRVAVCGTVNDLAMSGARPLFLTTGMIIEAGFPVDELKTICRSMAAAAAEANVVIVAGDTKVVDKGECDGIFINTAGVGIFELPQELSPALVEPGDVIIASGEIGTHGMAVMTARHNLDFSPPIASDVAPLNSLVAKMLAVSGAVKLLRDPTRGGIASTLNEWADDIDMSIEIVENNVPISPTVHAACDLLGVDPFYSANEGKLLAIVDAGMAQEVLNVMQEHPLGEKSAIIGQVTEDKPRGVYARTSIGSKRIVMTINGEQLPRIC